MSLEKEVPYAMSATPKKYPISGNVELVPDADTFDFLAEYGITDPEARERALRRFAKALADAEVSAARRRQAQRASGRGLAAPA